MIGALFKIAQLLSHIIYMVTHSLQLTALHQVFQKLLVIYLLPTSQPSEDARLARRQHYRAVRGQYSGDISSACKRCSVRIYQCKDHLANRRCAKNGIDTAANESALKMYVALCGVVPRQIGVVWWNFVFFMWRDIKGMKTFCCVLL